MPAFRKRKSLSRLVGKLGGRPQVNQATNSASRITHEQNREHAVVCQRSDQLQSGK